MPHDLSPPGRPFKVQNKSWFGIWKEMAHVPNVWALLVHNRGHTLPRISCSMIHDASMRKLISHTQIPVNGMVIQIEQRGIQRTC